MRSLYAGTRGKGKGKILPFSAITFHFAHEWQVALRRRAIQQDT